MKYVDIDINGRIEGYSTNINDEALKRCFVQMCMPSELNLPDISELFNLILLIKSTRGTPSLTLNCQKHSSLIAAKSRMQYLNVLSQHLKLVLKLE